MIVNFCKMHGLGNDFVVIDLITQGARLSKHHLCKIADRRLGIGCDQIIIVSPPTKPDIDFFYQIYNADGSEAEQCLNGLRCAARFFYDSGLSDRREFTAECIGGAAKLQVAEDSVTATLPINFSEISKLPLDLPNAPKEIYSLSVGNPHGVLLVNTVDNQTVRILGKKLSHAKIFPEGANIGFMQIVDRNKIKLRVFERGAGLTLACGSGACAAVLVGNHLNLLDKQVNVMFRHGELIFKVDPQTQSLTMTGPAASVFVGRFRI